MYAELKIFLDFKQGLLALDDSKGCSLTMRRFQQDDRCQRVETRFGSCSLVDDAKKKRGVKRGGIFKIRLSNLQIR